MFTVNCNNATVCASLCVFIHSSSSASTPSSVLFAQKGKFNEHSVIELKCVFTVRCKKAAVCVTCSYIAPHALETLLWFCSQKEKVNELQLKRVLAVKCKNATVCVIMRAHEYIAS